MQFLAKAVLEHDQPVLHNPHPQGSDSWKHDINCVDQYISHNSY